jgi:ATP-binding cassette subfamily B protein
MVAHCFSQEGEKPMSNRLAGAWRELILIVRRGRQTWRLVPFRHKMALGVGALLMVVTGACSTAVPVLMGRLVDDVKSSTEQGGRGDALCRQAFFYLALIGVAYLLREALQVGRRHLIENSCSRLEKLITVKLVSHLMKVDLASLTHDKVGALQGRISRSVVGFVRLLRLAFLDLLPPLLTGLFALVAALTKQPYLALAMVGVIPVSLLLTARQIASQKGVRLKLIRSREEMDGTVVELLGGMDYVRAAHTHQYEVERVAAAAEKRRKREIRHHFQMSLFGCAKAINEGAFHILVLALAIYLAVQGTISFGDILVFSMLFLNVMAPLNEVHRGLDEGHECSLQVANLLEMLAEPVDKSFATAHVATPVLKQAQPAIVVDDLHVEYATADGDRVSALSGISMQICHGETIGVVGRSGCGKSTWLRVLMRLAHPSRGAVFIGAVALEQISREMISQSIGYVGQSPFVFAGTMAENIAYGVRAASAEDIERAARAAYIHDDIRLMPGGYNAEVAERGRNLSGGQRQRLALARIFLKNPPILILDEGTSALDTISERHVQQAIDAARNDRTVILVAHRLSTLHNSDRIIVFENGRVTETGSYLELLARDGVFAELARCSHQPTAAGDHAAPPSPSVVVPAPSLAS